MKHWLHGIALICLCTQAQAAWQGKLELEPSVYSTVFRVIHAGQYLTGLTVPNLFRLNHNGNTILHAGLFHAWNAEGGNASFGPIVGIELGGISRDIGVDIPKAIGSIGESLRMQTIFKPVALFSSALSLDSFIGYRPIHTAAVIGELVYGGAITLAMPFGSQELKAGL